MHGQSFVRACKCTHSLERRLARARSELHVKARARRCQARPSACKHSHQRACTSRRLRTWHKLAVEHDRSRSEEGPAVAFINARTVADNRP
eukprot:1191606-Pleurochrysis_carterae.AAC.4